jgi:hypothetical protein
MNNMERKLASIQRILSLTPIKDADMIEKATILGWELVVAKKDGFKVDDLCVYCEIDSILPDKPEFEFLRERKFRIKTIKLKGQVSQGICFPLSVLPKSNYKEGQDVTNLMEVKKYDPQAEAERKEYDRLAAIDKNRMVKFLKRYSWFRRLIFKPTKIPFPAFIKKTDEDRLQLFPSACEEWKGIKFVATEKLDGQSGTYFMIPNPKKGIFRNKWIFGVCSRNFQLLKSDNSSYWSIAKELNLEKILQSHCEKTGCGVIVQGEIIGEKIQGNKYSKKGYELFVFNVFHHTKTGNISLNQTSQTQFCEQYKLNTVPVLAFDYFLPSSISEAVETAKGKSIFGIPKEGIVIRNYEKNISFKIINPDFLLKYQE